jgi:hypothetical protein
LSALGQLLVLWIFLAAAIFLVLMAGRINGIEREEGLPRSRYRFPLAAGVCALVGLLVLLSTLSMFRPGPAEPRTPAPQAEAEAGPDVAALARLEQQREQLRKNLQELENQIRAMRQSRPQTTATTQPASSDAEGEVASSSGGIFGISSYLGSVAVFLVPFLLVIGIVVLFFLSDQSLLHRLLSFRRNRSERRAGALATLNAIAAAADQGRYQEALNEATALDSNLLDRFDRLDWAYLKSYYAVQVCQGNDRPLMETAVRDLTTLLDEAPDRGEAVYLLSLVQGLLGQSRSSLDNFERAERLLPASLNLPFAHNQSVCLIRVAEEQLGSGDVEGAGKLFDRITALKTLVEQIPTTLVKVRLLNVRRSLQANNLPEARAGLEVIRQLKGLGEAQRLNVAVVCDALETLVGVREGDESKIDKFLDAFLERHLPAKLPEPDEALVDEYLDSPLEGIELRIDAQIYRAFLFLKAERTARLAGRQGRPLTAAQVQDIARPLLRGLQFEMRQRDILAALGGLYYWFVPEKRREAVRWLEASVNLGVESRIARRLLERDRQREVENRETLDWFRTTAARFLHDSSVSQMVRQALAEEFGRFQGFQPLLLGLDLENEPEQQEATLSTVRERAAYLEKMVAEFTERKRGALDAEFDQMRREYSALIGSFAAALTRMAEVERRLIQAIGKTIIS